MSFSVMKTTVVSTIIGFLLVATGGRPDHALVPNASLSGPLPPVNNTCPALLGDCNQTELALFRAYNWRYFQDTEYPPVAYVSPIWVLTRYIGWRSSYHRVQVGYEPMTGVYVINGSKSGTIRLGSCRELMDRLWADDFW